MNRFIVYAILIIFSLSVGSSEKGSMEPAPMDSQTIKSHLKTNLALRYAFYFGQLSAAVFSNPENKEIEGTSASKNKPSIMFNNLEFNGTKKEAALAAKYKVTHGTPISFAYKPMPNAKEIKTPIGYNISLPNDPKAIM